MKTLKQILELYKPKSQDEDKFVKKHIVVKHRDRNGNGDPVFQATNIKSVDRKAERHGYEPGQDEEVYEEVERLDEIGDSGGQKILALVRDRALKRRDAAKADISDLQAKQDAIADVHGEKAARNMPQHKELGRRIEDKFKEADRFHDTYDAAKARIDPARRSAMGLSKIKQNEQVEHLEEKLKVSDGIGAWITDFQESDAPQFDGKSRKERKKMAIAAFLSAKRGE